MKTVCLNLLSVFLCILVSAQAWANTPELQSDSELATAGYFRLSWQGSDGRDYVLQQANNPEFVNSQTLYQGPDTATLVSGRSDGNYYYRVRYLDKSNDESYDQISQHSEKANQWSNVAKVEVAHHSLSRAFIFFMLGAIVFVATLVIVVIGNAAQKS